MEKFMYLFRGGMAGGSAENMQGHMQKWMAWIEKLKAENKYVAGATECRQTNDGSVQQFQNIRERGAVFAEVLARVGGKFTHIVQHAPHIDGDAISHHT